jgi:hypothetical protein
MTPNELKLFTRFPTCRQCDPDYLILLLHTALRKEKLLLIKQEDVSVPVFDTAEIHARAAVAHALK